jgi:hypothetical protein
MLKVNDIIHGLTDSQMEYELKMSCMTADYTKDKPKSANNGYVYLENDDKLYYQIDWKGHAICYVDDLPDFGLETEVVSYDMDDCCEIEFTEVYVCDELEVVILI